MHFECCKENKSCASIAKCAELLHCGVLLICMWQVLVSGLVELYLTKRHGGLCPEAEHDPRRQHTRHFGRKTGRRGDQTELFSNERVISFLQSPSLPRCCGLSRMDVMWSPQLGRWWFCQIHHASPRGCLDVPCLIQCCAINHCAANGSLVEKLGCRL